MAEQVRLPSTSEGDGTEGGERRQRRLTFIRADA